MAATDYTQRYIYRITHRDNIPYLLANGICARNHPQYSATYVNIGHSDVIAARAATNVRIPDYGLMHDYVPFYYNIKSIMLYNIITGYRGVTQRNQDAIVALVAQIATVVNSGRRFFFTDGQGNARMTSHYNNTAELEKIDWGLISSGNFRNDNSDPDKTRRYQAEFHVHNELPLAHLAGIATYNEATAEWVRQAVANQGLQILVKPKPSLYF